MEEGLGEGPRCVCCRYIVAHVLARRLIYPGSNAVFNILFGNITS